MVLKTTKELGLCAMDVVASKITLSVYHKPGAFSVQRKFCLWVFAKNIFSLLVILKYLISLLRRCIRKSPIYNPWLKYNSNSPLVLIGAPYQCLWMSFSGSKPFQNFKYSLEYWIGALLIDMDPNSWKSETNSIGEIWCVRIKVTKGSLWCSSSKCFITCKVVQTNLTK